MRRAIALVVTAVALTAVGQTAFQAGRILEEGSVLGGPRRDATWWLLGASLVGVTAVCVVAWAPLRLDGKVMAVAATALGCCAALVVGLDRGFAADACDRFEVDRAAFSAAVRDGGRPGRTSAAEYVARGVEHCRTLEGASRADVRKVLGAPSSRRGSEWRWSAGTANDYSGPGDGIDLVVRFDRGGRVVATEYGG